MFPLRISIFALLFALLTLPLSSTRVAADSLDEAKTLVLKSNAVFRSFMRDSNMAWFHENVDSAYGILIVPQMLRGGFIVGGSGGSGVLLVRDRNTGTWSYPAFYTVGSLSLGLQVGADASEIVLMIMTETGLNAMLSTELKLGADISVAVGPVGKNAKAQTADLLAFGRSKGIFGGISVEGAVIAPRYNWNNAYYGGMVTPLDILMRRAVNNTHAEPLRRAMPGGKAQYPPPPHYQPSYSPDQGYDFGSPAPGHAGYRPDTFRTAEEGYQGSTWRNPDEYRPQGSAGDVPEKSSWRNPDELQQQYSPRY